MAVCSTGAGSARPVVSSSTRRKVQRRLSRSRSSVSSASTRSPRMVQHRQPDCSSTILSPTYSTSRWSSATSPNSLMMTAVSASAGSFSRRLSSVVLPAPRKPVSTVSGIGRRRPARGRRCPASLIVCAAETFGFAVFFAGFWPARLVRSGCRPRRPAFFFLARPCCRFFAVRLPSRPRPDGRPDR